MRVHVLIKLDTYVYNPQLLSKSGTVHAVYLDFSRAVAAAEAENHKIDKPRFIVQTKVAKP